MEPLPTVPHVQQVFISLRNGTIMSYQRFLRGAFARLQTDLPIHQHANCRGFAQAGAERPISLLAVAFPFGWLFACLL